jgi:hypothetical protein
MSVGKSKWSFLRPALVWALLLFAPSTAHADSQWQRIVQQCASYITCPTNLTPSQARSLRGMGVSLDQSLRWCAAGFGCPEGMTQEQAERLQGERPVLSTQEQNAALIRCTMTGICPAGLSPEDAELFVEPVPTEGEIELTEQADRDHRQLLDEIRTCAGGGRCPIGLDQQAAQDIYQTPTRVDRTIRLCVNNLGCPPNLSPNDADFAFEDQGPITSADINFALHRCARTGVCPPNITPETARDLMGEVRSPELRPVYACAERGLCLDNVTREDAIDRIQRETNWADAVDGEPEGNRDDLSFEEDEIAIPNEGEEQLDNLVFSPFEAAGPIAVAAVVEAATPSQTVPRYSVLADFLEQRLPGFLGNTFMESLGTQTSSPDQLGTVTTQDAEVVPPVPLAPSQSATHELVGYPGGMPQRITLSRDNQDTSSRGNASARSALVISRPESGAWGLTISANISTDQFSFENEGARQILTRPRTDASMLAYIPVDTGGAGRSIDVYVNARFTGGSGQLVIVPYIDSGEENLSSIAQVVQVHSQRADMSAQDTAIARGFLEQFSGITGLALPRFADEVDSLESFDLAETGEGVQRGLLVTFEASAAPEVLSTVDTIRNSPVRLGRVTDVTERADFSFRGEVIILPQ